MAAFVQVQNRGIQNSSDLLIQHIGKRDMEIKHLAFLKLFPSCHQWNVVLLRTTYPNGQEEPPNNNNYNPISERIVTGDTSHTVVQTKSRIKIATITTAIVHP